MRRLFGRHEVKRPLEVVTPQIDALVNRDRLALTAERYRDANKRLKIWNTFTVVGAIAGLALTGMTVLAASLTAGVIGAGVGLAAVGGLTAGVMTYLSRERKVAFNEDETRYIEYVQTLREEESKRSADFLQEQLEQYTTQTKVTDHRDLEVEDTSVESEYGHLNNDVQVKQQHRTRGLES